MDNFDEPMFSDKDENGYAIQVCRDSINASANDESMPLKKARVLDKILGESENYLLNHVSEIKPKEPDPGDQKEESPDNVNQNIIEQDFSERKKTG